MALENEKCILKMKQLFLHGTCDKYFYAESLLNCAPCARSRLRALPIIDTRLTGLRVLPIINTHLCAFTHNKRLTRLFLSCVVASIVKYGLRLKKPRNATGPDFIPLKVTKFASNVIDSNLKT